MPANRQAGSGRQLEPSNDKTRLTRNDTTRICSI